MLFVAVAANHAAQHHILTNAQRSLGIRYKAQTGFEDTYAVLLTILVIDHGGQQAAPQRKTHRGHFTGDRAWQTQRFFARVNQLLHFRIDEAISNHFLVAFVIQHRFYALERQVSFFMAAHYQTGLHRLVRDVVIAKQTRNFFYQVFFNFHVETPARRNGLPLVVTDGHFTAQTLENIGHHVIGNVMTNQAIQLAATQGDGRTFRQRRFVGNIDNRASFTAADIHQQAGGALQGFVLQRRIDTTLIAVRGIRMQAMTTRAASNRQRVEESALQQNVLRFAIHARVLTAKNAAHCQRFVMVGNDQGIGFQFRFATVKQNQRFALFRHAHNDTAFDTIFIECVHRLAQFKQHVVGDVNNRVNGTNTAATQFFFHPQRGWCFDVDAFHYATQIARAGVGGFNGDRQRVVDGGGNRRNFRLNQRQFVQHRYITGNPDDTEAVGAVRRDADFDSVVIKLQVFTDIGTDRRIRWQFDNAAMVVGNTQFGERTQHPFRRFTAQFGGFNFEIARQYRADGGNCHTQALTAVWRATDDIKQAFTAYIHFRYAQFVGVRVLTALNHFAHNHAVEGARNRLNAVDFQACHGNLTRQRFAIDGRVNPFA